MSTASLLVELLTEELPPRSLARLSEAFATMLAEHLRAGQFLSSDSQVHPYATPRRLAVRITSVQARSPDRAQRVKVLPVAIAFNPDGSPSATLAKKLAALGIPQIAPDALERAPDGKAEALFYPSVVPGVPLEEGLQAALTATVEGLPIPKVMRYQRHGGTRAEETVQFVRPAHRLVALYGSDIVPVTALGLDAGRTTLGHRFLSEGPLTLTHADDYERVLHDRGRVVANLADRRRAIVEQLTRTAAGDTVLAPEALLDEVNALVEWPVVYAGEFEPEFLAVPQECLILTMQQNQRYFALTDAHGRMKNRFLLVSNLETAEPEAIIGGNERVLRARLSDAKFFFEQDQKRPLAARVPLLDQMVYHKALGTLGERVRRLCRIAAPIGAALGLSAVEVERSALLAKADLVTEMVGEFAELQGTMGRYYALHDGESPAVAEAIGAHYRPRFAGDALPDSRLGAVIALADKLETLTGMFGVGNAPTGDRDPYGLRRAALGVLRIVIEERLALPLSQLLEWAAAAFAEVPQFTPETDALADFFFERLRSLMREDGYSATEVEALLSMRPDRVERVPVQLAAVRSFAALPEAERLAAANKRIGNILKKLPLDPRPAATGVPGAIEPAEAALTAALGQLQRSLDEQFERADYTGYLKSLASLARPVDDFFDQVLVMSEDPGVRARRLSLLRGLHGAMNRFADLSKLASEGRP